MRSAEAPNISVIIPVFRGASTIKACLASVRQAVAGWSHEILVVESSGDGSAECVRQCCPEARVIAWPHRLSAGEARNQGIRQARGRWLFFVDQDCEVPLHWVDRLMCHLQGHGVGGAGGSIAVGNPQMLSGWAVYFLEFLQHFPAALPARRCNGFLIACNSAWRADVLSQCSFPDQTLGEDVLFSHAVRQQGLALIYDPAISVRHQNRCGWAEFRRYNRAMGRASAAYQLELRSEWLNLLQKWPFLIFGAPLIVLPLIAWRLLRAPAGYLPRYLLLLPVCLQGQLLWASAFRRELLSHRRVHRPRDVCRLSPEIRQP